MTPPEAMPFARWMYMSCAIDDRVWGGLETLWKAFSGWVVRQGRAAVSWEEFMEVMTYWRMPIAMVGETLIVKGVALREDVALHAVLPASSGEERR